MAGEEVINLGSFSGTADGAAFAIGSVKNATLMLAGTFVATIAVQGSYNGVDWAVLISENGTALSLTSPGCYPLKGAFPFVRARCNAYTSGTAEVRLVKSGVIAD